MGKETSKGHKKHADIKRPHLGNYARQEIGMLGAPCGVIKSMVETLAQQLKGQISLTYLDADHQEAVQPTYARATDHISHDSITYQSRLNDFDRRLAFTSSDLLIINGNHFLADQQIVFCTASKKESLQRKLDRLTNVRMIILDKGIDGPHEFLYDHIDHLESIPTYRIDQVHEISNLVRRCYDEGTTSINGLVLAGGKSQRMGSPKEQLDYHGRPQVEHALAILESVGIHPYISCRDHQQAERYQDQATVVDTFVGLGPFGAILSAFRSEPNTAWCVIACDQPLMQESHIADLVAQRDTTKVATCYHNPDTGFPEPLITIWEPRAYHRLVSFMTLGYSCPRKVLINSDVHVIHVDDHRFMKNANTPAEREEVLSMIKPS